MVKFKAAGGEIAGAIRVPLANPDFLTPGGQSAVLWNKAAAQRLFTQLRTDQAHGRRPPAHPGHRPAALHPGQVSADVYNGTMIGGLSAGTGADLARVNTCGGAIALGHPLGATGAKLLATLIHGLRRTGGRYGLVTMCIGVGQGIAMIVERL